MYIFGGRTEEGNDLGDLAAFRISSRRWYTFQNMGPSPSPRSGHSMTAFGKHIVVIGGEPSSAPRDAGELSRAYYLDTSKIRYPADSQVPISADQRTQGMRRPSGDRSGIPQSRALPAPAPRDPNEPVFDGSRRIGRDAPQPVQRVNDSTNATSRLPRAAAASPAQSSPQTGPMQQQAPTAQPGPGVLSPRVQSPQIRQPTRPERPERPERAMSPSTDAPFSPVDQVSANTLTDGAMSPRQRAGLASPVQSNVRSFSGRDESTQQTYKPQAYQPSTLR